MLIPNGMTAPRMYWFIDLVALTHQEKTAGLYHRPVSVAKLGVDFVRYVHPRRIVFSGIIRELHKFVSVLVVNYKFRCHRVVALLTRKLLSPKIQSTAELFPAGIVSASFPCPREFWSVQMLAQLRRRAVVSGSLCVPRSFDRTTLPEEAEASGGTGLPLADRQAP